MDIASTLVISFEASRRASKNLAVLGLIFLLYNFFGKYIPGDLGTSVFFKAVLNHMIWGSQGIFGVGMVSAQLIFSFLSFLELI